MIARIIDDEIFEEYMETPARARTPAAYRAIGVASDMVWRFLGARVGEDLAYKVGAVENHQHRGGILRLRRRPVSTLTTVRLLLEDGTIVRDYDVALARIVDAQRGWIEGRSFPTTNTYVRSPYERVIRDGGPHLEITFTGGWITGLQAKASSGSLTKDIPETIEHACATQAIHIYNSRMRDFDVQTKSDQGSSKVYRDRRSAGRDEIVSPGGLLPEVADYLRPFQFIPSPL